MKTRFIDNKDGTIMDNETYLMWEQKTEDMEFTWQTARDRCKNLDLAGHKDWRLPTRIELESILDLSRFDPAIDPIFQCFSSNYWSSTTYGYSINDAWRVNFDDGYVDHYYKLGIYYVRAVRAEE